MKEYGLAGPYIPHLRESGWFPDEEHLASDSSEDLAKDVMFATDDIVEYLADVRAKRILIELRGLGKLHLVDTDINHAIEVASVSASSRGADSADNVATNDESRWKPGSSSHKTIDVEKTRRAYVLKNASTSFPGVTVLLSMSGSAEKLGVQFVLAAERLPAITIPTQEELGLPADVVLPDPLAVVCRSSSGWMNHKLYKAQYREHILRPWQTRTLAARIAKGQAMMEGTQPVVVEGAEATSYVQTASLVRHRALQESICHMTLFLDILPPTTSTVSPKTACGWLKSPQNAQRLLSLWLSICTPICDRLTTKSTAA